MINLSTIQTIFHSNIGKGSIQSIYLVFIYSPLASQLEMVSPRRDFSAPWSEMN